MACDVAENPAARLSLVSGPDAAAGSPQVTPPKGNQDRHSRTHIAKHVEADLLVLWLLKDVGWVLLLPFVSLPTAFAAIVVCVLLMWHHGTGRCILSTLLCGTELCWLLGNSIWMLADTMFSNNDAGLPYRFVLIADGWGMPLRQYADWCVTTAALFFAAGLILIVIVYVFVFSGKPDTVSNDLQANHTRHFIAFWIAKDFCWIQKLYVSGALYGILALAAVVLAYRNCADTSQAKLLLADMLWICGNIIWMTEELHLNDTAPLLRVVVALLVLLGALTAMPYTIAAGVIADKFRSDLDERKALLGAPAAEEGRV